MRSHRRQNLIGGTSTPGGVPRQRFLRTLMLASALAVMGVASHVKAEIDDLRQLVIYVNAVATTGGNGSRVAPFQTIQEGVAAARAAWNASPGLKLVVRVAPSPSGSFYSVSGTTPILIDVPLELRGSNAMEEDDFGWPTGVVWPGTETLVKAVPGLTANTENMIRVIVDRVTVANLSLDANTSNQAGIQLALRGAQDFTVSGNRVTGQSFIGINPKASSGKIIGNYITNVGCGRVSVREMGHFRQESCSAVIAQLLIPLQASSSLPRATVMQALPGTCSIRYRSQSARTISATTQQ